MDENTITQSEQESPEPNSGQSEQDVLNNKITELEASNNQLKDQLLRKAAEFDNYKKRMESDYASMVKFANEDLVSTILPVLDDFHRSIKVSQAPSSESKMQEQPGNDVLLRGLELIYNKFVKILESHGVKTFDSLGKPFDPYYHDALLQVPRTDVPPHTVIEEVEKGYTLNEKVIRHAKVIVSGEMQQAESPNDSDTVQHEKNNDEVTKN